MSQLMELLKAGAAENTQEKKVLFTTRYKDEDGNPVQATITTMTSKQYNNYRKQSTTFGRKGKVDFDQEKFNNLLVINHTKDPDFRNAKDIQDMGLQTPEQLLDKVLIAGEVQELATAIAEHSGFGESIEELKNKAKN